MLCADAVWFCCRCLELWGRVADWIFFAACVVKALLTVNGKWSYSWATVCIKTAGELPNAVTLMSTS